MHKKLLYTTLSLLLASTMSQSMSQEMTTTNAQTPDSKSQNKNANSNSINNSNQNSTTTNVPSNTAVNYNPGSANLNGEQIAVPNNSNGMRGRSNLPNGLPNQSPNGLPQDAGSVVNVNHGGTIDPVEATINILNTSDEKIREINRDIDRKGKVISEVPRMAPKVDNGVIVARLEPGSVSPVIRLAKNRTTTITLTDMTGQPWPIINYDGLSESDFTVKRLDNPAPDGYVLSITPKSAFASGNLVLVLKGLAIPISVDFVSNQKFVDGSKQIRVQGKGPNTQLTSISLPDSLDTNLLSILQGVAPEGLSVLKTSTAAVQAWKSKDGSMYVRTRYKVMSPAFENVTSSPDGTYAYKMQPVSVVLYKAAEGRFGEFNVDGF